MKDGRVNLSARLQMLADMVTPGSRVADVGCDHGLLPIRLVQDGVAPAALAMDVRRGPLEAAEANVRLCGLEDYITLRLSDGLKEYRIGEADAVVCAGMGGRLMQKILSESAEKVKTLRELILQPQSELKEFRAYLRKNGFAVRKESAVFEDGKYYFAMKVSPRNVEKSAGEERLSAESVQLYDSFGRQLLEEKNPVLLAFLEQRKKALLQLVKALSAGEARQAERLEKLQEELSVLDGALEYFGITKRTL